MNSQSLDTVTVSLRLRCFLRQEADYWVSGCPALDVYSQADEAEAAKAALQEAVELWMDSCLERNTLQQALVELGWHRVPPDQRVTVDAEYIGISEAQDADQVLGEPFPIEVTVPAFQAALLNERARATVVIPKHRTLAPDVVRSNMRTLGVSREELEELLDSL